MKKMLLLLSAAAMTCGVLSSCSKDIDPVFEGEDHVIVETRANTFVPENLLISKSYGFHTITLNNWTTGYDIESVECLDPWTQVMSIDSYNGKVMINIMSSNNTSDWKTYRFKFTILGPVFNSPSGPLRKVIWETLTVHQPFF